MALYEANVSFDHGGQRIHAGDVVDGSNHLYVLFPSRFTALTDEVIGGATATISGLATADPAAAGRLWNNGGTLMVSGGA